MNKGFLNFPHIYQKMNSRCHFTEKRSYTENHRGNFHSTYLPLITSQGWCIWIEGTLVRSKGLEEMAIPHSLLQLALPPSTACILFPNQINKAFPIKIPLTLDSWTINAVIHSFLHSKQTFAVSPDPTLPALSHRGRHLGWRHLRWRKTPEPSRGLATSRKPSFTRTLPCPQQRLPTARAGWDHKPAV